MKGLACVSNVFCGKCSEANFNNNADEGIEEILSVLQYCDVKQICKSNQYFWFKTNSGFMAAASNSSRCS